MTCSRVERRWWKNNACSGPGRNADRPPQTHHRVEYGADGVRKRPSVDDRYGVADVVPAPDKPRAVGFELQVADSFTLHHDHMRGPNGSFLVGLPAARCQQRADIRDKFGLNE